MLVVLASVLQFALALGKIEVINQYGVVKVQCCRGSGDPDNWHVESLT